jgi:dTMP kinase
LCDRFTDSTLAYQGYGRGIDLLMLRQLNQVASHGIQPDLTFLLDCPVEVGLSRTAKRVLEHKSPKRREDRFERERLEFHERVRRGFLEMAQKEPERIYVLDGSRPIPEVHEGIKKIVHKELEGAS